MAKTIKKTLACVLALMMLVCSVPTVFAIESDEVGFSFSFDKMNAENIYDGIATRVGDEVWVVKKMILISSETGVGVSYPIVLGEDGSLSVATGNDESSPRQTYYFDENGNVAKIEIVRNDAGEDIEYFIYTKEYAYDSNNNFIKESKKVTYKKTDGSIENEDISSYDYRLAYDESGKILSITTDAYDDENETTVEVGVWYEYDSHGNVIKETDKGINSLNETCFNYVYDENGNMISAGLSDSEPTFTYEYDQNGKLIKAIDGGSTIYTFEYQTNGKLYKSVKTIGDDIMSVETYDADGKLIRVENDIYSIVYEWTKLEFESESDPTAPEEKPDDKTSFLDKLIAFFQRIIDWFKSIFG